MLSRLAEYLESEPERLAAKAEAQRAKLEALERKLGIDNNAASSSAPNPSTSSNTPPPVLAGKKHRFDDSEYLEQSRELSEGVRNAVSSALLKKRKKVKVSSPGEGTVPEKVDKVPSAAPTVSNAAALDALGA